MKTVEVSWTDSAFHRGWGTQEEKTKAMGTSACRTVGYLLAKTKRDVRIVQSVSEDGYADGISIPLSCVTAIRTLRGGRRRRRATR